MPDPERKSISASQAAGLWNASPYLTRWMLYRHFANGVALESEEDERMREGRRLQPFVLSRAAAELRLEVIDNERDVYVRNGLLGATRDAVIVCPDRGPGALETKCVFDYRIWMTDWYGGERVPPHIEVQIQQQMKVGDGEKSFGWGVIAVWVCAAQVYFERAPHAEMWQRLDDSAAAFFDDVRERREPDPFGSVRELDWVMSLYPTRAASLLDLREVDGAERLSELCRIYLAAKATATLHESVAKTIRAEIIATMKGAELLLLPGEVAARMGKRNRLKITAPGAPEDSDE